MPEPDEQPPEETPQPSVDGAQSAEAGQNDIPNQQRQGAPEANQQRQGAPVTTPGGKPMNRRVWVQRAFVGVLGGIGGIIANDGNRHTTDKWVLGQLKNNNDSTDATKKKEARGKLEKGANENPEEETHFISTTASGLIGAAAGTVAGPFIIRQMTSPDQGRK